MRHITDNLGRRSTAAVMWSVGSQSGRQLISLVTSMLLARLLGPEAYGLMGMVAVVNGFGALFLDMGFGAALVQRHDLRSDHLTSVFWANIALGVFLMLCMCGTASLVARLFNEPSLVPLLRVTSIGFVINGLALVQISLATRRMDFKLLSGVEVVSAFFGGAVGLLLAFSNAGVWSLVVLNLAGSVATVVGVWFISSWRPKFAFSMTALSELIGFGANLLGFWVFNYWVRNADNLIIGRYLGSAALGIYDRAYSLGMLPIGNITGVMARAMIPALTSIQHDKPRVKGVYLRAIRIIAVVSLPVIVGMFSVADTLIGALLGAKWVAMVPVFRVLCVAFLLQPVGSTVGWLYMSQGRTDLMMRWGVASGVMYVASYCIGVKWGVLGVAYAYCFTNYIILQYPAWAIPARLIGLSFVEMLKPLLSIFLYAFMMGFVVWAVGIACVARLPIGVVLTIQIIIGIGIYSSLIFLRCRGDLTDLKTLLLGLRSLGQPGA